MRLHPKFAVRDKIDDGEMEYQGELGFAKLRIRLLKEEEEKLNTDDEEDDLGIEDDREEDDLQELVEAKSRQFYDPELKCFDYSKKCATEVQLMRQE